MAMQQKLISAPAQASMMKAQQLLEGKGSLLVQQFKRKRDVCDCDFNNFYKVTDPAGQEIFYVKEDSSCIERNCCHADCKAWRMDVFIPGPSADIRHDDHAPFMHLERPFTLTCCCLNRPTVHVSEFSGKGSNPTGRKIGSLYDPFVCCSLNTTITAEGSNDPHLQIVGAPCQFGLCCPCPGNTVEFPVKDPSGKEIAHLTKIWKCGDICPLFNEEWSTFDVNFKEIKNQEDKFLMISTALFVQLLWFDKRNKDKNNN